MVWNWNTIFVVLVTLGFIVLFDWSRLKNTTKNEKFTFISILSFCFLMSLLDLENIPGPITLLHYIFGPLENIMQ